jgi:hypothetical protein
MTDGKYNNKPVIDAAAPMNILISKADVVGAKAGNPEQCAAARAINREQPSIVAAHVYRSRVFVEYRDRVVRFLTPARLRQETISFDRGTPGSFIEGEYTILPPYESAKLGAPPRPGRPGGKNRTPIERHDVKGARKNAGNHLYWRGKKER